MIEGGEAIGEAGHRTSDADAPGVHATAHMIDGTASGDIALYHGAPAADLYQALFVAIFFGEGTLFVIASANAPLMNRLIEEPGRSPKLVELRKGTETVEEK